MAEPKPDPPARSATTPATASATPSSSTSALPPPSAAARQRLSQRVGSGNKESSPSPRPNPLSRRRSSLLSYSSIEDVRLAFADDIINPRTRGPRNTQDDSEPSHWHSSPLAFAILPAIGGLLFKNGSAFVTDALLLGLAAIFMNWSIRLPWDWYYSAQALRRDVEPDLDADDLEDETAVDTASEAGSPKPSANRRRDTVTGTERPIEDVDKREEAASDLRRQETLALVATFLFPALAAYLLHVIRAQLSTPSTSLVSDYNLSIFLLAAEIRPVRHLVRLMANRTLHLQRTVTGIDDPFSSVLEEKSTISSLANRIAELEAKLSEHTVVPQTMSMAQKADVSDLSLEIRKRYEPRLEGLERAVRRYEKRSTTMAIATEGRLQSLEDRLQDALNLAAVAARYSQSRGVVAKSLETASSIIAFPMKIGLEVAIWPFRVVDDLYVRIKTLLIGPIPQRSAKRRSAKHDSSATSSRDENGKPRDKAPLRKIVR